MKRVLPLFALVIFLTPTRALAQFQQIDLSIFGMD